MRPSLAAAAESTKVGSGLGLLPSTAADGETVAAMPDTSPTALAFDELFRHEYPRLVRILVVATADRDAAADLAQDAFVQLHRHWDEVSGYEDPGRWLRRVALNRATNHRRGRDRRNRFVARHGPEVASTEAVDAVPDLDLWRALVELPPRQRAVVALHHLDDLPVAEIALLLGVAEGTVKSQLHDARRALARSYRLTSEEER